MANTNRTKVCSKCKNNKSIDLFGRHNSNKDGLQYYCKKCRKTYIIKNQDHISKLRKKNYSKHRDKNLARSARWNRTLDGKIKSAYNSIICRVKTKSRHNAKTYYGLDFCSKQTFYNFSNNNIDLEYLMMKWKESNYDRRYAPSIDRITSSKGYVMGNMEWITLSDNVKRSWLKNNPDAKR